MTIEITPPQLHMHLQVLSSAGILAISTVGTPGIQGAAVTGTHGIGVNTPNAAAVAAATIGFAGEVHIPNGRMLTIGLLSMILAAGLLSTMTLFTGNTISELGARPKLHIKFAVATTWFGISLLR